VIAMTGIADTISPAAILGLNIPVGRIGSNPAGKRLRTRLIALSRQGRAAHRGGNVPTSLLSQQTN